MRLRVTTHLVSRPYIGLTTAVMGAFGATVREDAPESGAGPVYVVEPGGYRAASYQVEPDASLSAGELERRKDEILNVLRSFKYLAKWKLVSASFAPISVLTQIEKTQGWDQQKK